MTEKGPDWLMIVLARGLFALPDFSSIRFLLSFVLWSIVGIAVAFGMLALVFDGAGG